MSTLNGVRIADMPDLGLVTDTTSFVGEHAGSGRFSATALRNYTIAGLPGVPAVGIPEAPTDGQFYGRASGSWQPVVPLTAPSVTAWNGRTGSVTMTLADVTGVGGASQAALDSVTAALNALTTRVAYIEAHYIKPS
jgi:hypothetical protein